MMCTHHRKRLPGQHREGNVVVLTAVMLVVLFAMVAFAIDIGYMTHAKTELQRTADTCALAAVSHLPDSGTAQTVAQSTAAQNYGTVGPDIEASDVEFGDWDRDSATFTSPPSWGQDPDAVRVTLRRTAERGNPLRLFFGHMVGTSQAEIVVSAIAMYDHQLCGPFVGIDWLSVPGSVFSDSFNSDVAHYDAATARDRGSLCSDGPIGLEGSVYIKGDARAGKGTGVTLSGQPILTGSKGTRLKPLNLPPVDATDAEVDNDNDQIPLIRQGNSWSSPVDGDGNFLLDGNRTIDMPPGTYYLKNFTMEGQSAFNVSGDTTIYVTGNMDRAGGTSVNNSTQKAGTLKIMMTGGTANITSSDVFYGLIYAPETDVTLDGCAEYFGAVVGKTLTITGSATGHYDECLSLHEVDLPRRTALVD